MSGVPDRLTNESLIWKSNQNLIKVTRKTRYIYLDFILKLLQNILNHNGNRVLDLPIIYFQRTIFIVNTQVMHEDHFT